MADELIAARTKAKRVTGNSGSNLAAMLYWMPPARRADMLTFYAFCRLVDDDADDAEFDSAEKMRRLDVWDRALEAEAVGEDKIMPAVRDVLRRNDVPVELPQEILRGARMDVQGRSYASWDQLQEYIDCVAVAVGLVSIRVFGCVHEDSERFARALGTALQLTNILRDVGTDWRNGRRVYLPADEIARFGCLKEHFSADEPDPSCIELFEFQAARARACFEGARESIAKCDRAALLPARLMAAIYLRLLTSLAKSGWDVLGPPYKLGGGQRLLALSDVAFGRW